MLTRLTEWLVVLCTAVLLGLTPARAEPEPSPSPSPLPLPSPSGPSAAAGGLVLLGCPPEVAVLIDGQTQAVTPLRAPLRLVVGRHTVQLRRAGYRSFEGPVQIAAERVVALEVEMPRTAGVLMVTSSVPASRVYVDGTPRGEAPLELEVSQGPHQVRVHRDGYYEDTFQFEAVLGEVTTHEARLRELPPSGNPYRKIVEKRPWYGRWWVWTLAAVGAAGIAVAVIVPVVLSSRSPCQRLDAEVCFPVQAPPAAAPAQAQTEALVSTSTSTSTSTSAAAAAGALLIRF